MLKNIVLDRVKFSGDNFLTMLFYMGYATIIRLFRHNLDENSRVPVFPALKCSGVRIFLLLFLQKNSRILGKERDEFETNSIWRDKLRKSNEE